MYKKEHSNGVVNGFVMSGVIDRDVEKTMSPAMREEWLIVNGLPTLVLKIGEIQAQLPLVIILPGNPGVANFYEEFMLMMYEKSGYRLPIWCVSHAGQVTLPEEIAKKNPRNGSLGLDTQLRHKARFLHDFVPKEQKLILIGHSIGAYMVLQMVKEISPDRLVKGVLLFPTIERMADSPKGSFMKPVIRYCSWLAVLATYPLYCFLPSPVKRVVANWYFRGTKVPDCSVVASLRLVDPSCVGNIFYLGRTELDQVREVQHDIIRPNIDKLMFYYGQGDPWCPVQYYHDMKKTYPEADIRLCARNMEHAFVLEYSTSMAEVLWDWLSEKLPYVDHRKQ